MTDQPGTPPADPVAAGHAVYTPFTLQFYDLVVLHVSCLWIWGCPAHEMLELYNRYLGPRHLEMGVGTGWFLEHCKPVTCPLEVTLADANPACLRSAMRRIRKANTRTLLANVLEPLPIAGRPFDSIGLNFVLHCLPGPLAEKAAALKHLAAVLSPEGVLFGSTLIAQGGRHSWASRLLMSFYNRQKIFSNRLDTLDELRRALQLHFREHRVWTRGCVALFVARAPRL